MKKPADFDLLLGEIENIARICRSIWLPVWPYWKLINGHSADGNELPSHGACIPTSFALAGVLSATVPELRWRVVGGRPTKRTPAGGYTGDDGTGWPHLWVEGRKRGNLVVVDITCDQFGGPDVHVCRGPSPRHKPNSTRQLLDKYEEYERQTAADWMELVAAFG